MSLPKLFIAAALVIAAQANAQTASSTSGALVIVPAFGEVTHANDQATATFAVEEHDKDKAAAASRVNQKMKQGTEIIRREDPQASLKTQGYYTYPIYPEPRPVQGAGMPKAVPVGWRVGQYLEVKTTNLAALPKTTAAAQKVMSLNNLRFGLAPATLKQLDDRRIAATYLNLNERIASIAAAMGRRPADAVIDTIDFEGSGRYAQQEVSVMGSRAMAKMDAAEVAEPTFEPGETTLQMRLVGKLKFR
ncbi:SIMPL domain-containing protein [Massilia eurypsychrophila]|jgi:predicted secreted protein|uniref:SIMPL domain-containing protein n=1 Tax=Massilia eurypsychrophila TaxID=1485217 RepID=A0A2G8TF94_9BURK|nr:SIMPL domain-containing protein [Massilia eurypsychrophila]PIL44318.1 SIMPL domain-containing protein [Massilia eurypsychrophila]